MSTFDLILLVVVYGIVLGVLLSLTRTLAAAGDAARERPTANRLILAIWVWAALATVYALNVGTAFLWLAPSLFIPLVAGLGVTFLKPAKRILRRISIASLVGVQVYRLIGAVFLILYFFTDSDLSRAFALNAGWGDVLTGLLAIPVALAAAYRIRFWPVMVVLWCLFGIGDLILAPITAQLYGGPAVDGFPLNILPILLGPPLGILLHLLALRSLWLQRAATGADAAGTLQAGRTA